MNSSASAEETKPTAESSPRAGITGSAIMMACHCVSCTSYFADFEFMGDAHKVSGFLVVGAIDVALRATHHELSRSDANELHTGTIRK
jgi:hypothetical protein